MSKPLVRFNRKFTQAELAAAVGSGYIIHDEEPTAVVDGTWYIAKTGASALYVGSIETPGEGAVLKCIAEDALDGYEITEAINYYLTHHPGQEAPDLIDHVQSAINDSDGNQISATYLKKTGGLISGGGDGSEGEGGVLYFSHTDSGEPTNKARIYGDDSGGITIKSVDSGGVKITHDNDNVRGDESISISQNNITIGQEGGFRVEMTPTLLDSAISGLSINDQNGSSIISVERALFYDSAIINVTASNFNYNGHPVATTDMITSLDGTITKTAGSASASTAAASYQKVPVVSGFVLKEVDGKLVETTAASGPSTVSTVDVDIAGSAQKALADAKDYADGLITALGTIMHFQGTVATETDLKNNITTPSKGDVYVVTADGSEWVYTGDTVDATHPYDSTKWQKFGTTDVVGALYKGSNALTDGTLVMAEGTDGKVKAISDSALATRLADETAFTEAYKPKQTAVSTDPTASGVASAVVTSVLQDADGVITVTRANSPTASGGVGSSSSSADAWKTVVHDVSLSGAAGSNHSLSGNTKSIPAASGSGSGSDGYMTAAQAVKLAGIETGAQVNQNAFSQIDVYVPNDSTSLIADSPSGILSINQSSNITITANAVSDTLTFSTPDVSGSVGSSSSDADAWKTVVHDIAGSGHGITGATKTIPEATISADGYMSALAYTTLVAVSNAITWDE